MRRLGYVEPHSPEWHERRRQSVGASEVAGVLCMGNPAWHNPANVWAAKVSTEPAELDARGQMLTSFGTALEPFILREVSAVLATPVHAGAALGTLAHDDAPHLTCHLDGYLDAGAGELVPVEAKWSGSPHAPGEWSRLHEWLTHEGAELSRWPLELGGTAIESYWWQVQAQMAITGASQAYLCGLLGYEAAVALLAGLPLPDDSLRVLLVPRNDAICERIPREVEGFWARHVVTRDPPTVTAASLDALRNAAREASDEAVTVNKDTVAQSLADKAAAEAELREVTKPLQERIDKAKAVIEAELLGSQSDRLLCDGWEIRRSWVATKPREAGGYWKTGYKAPKGAKGE